MFANPGKFACGTRNPGLWNPEYSSRITESHLRLESGIQISLNRIREYLESTAWNPESNSALNSLTWSDVESSHKHSGSGNTCSEVPVFWSP